MPVVVFDSGFLLSLAADKTYADATRQLWTDDELWVPRGVIDELRIRATRPIPTLPPELPKQALGLVGSGAWKIVVIEMTDAEAVEVAMLQDRLGGPASSENAGECEAAVIVASRAPGALLATDDRKALPVLFRYVKDRTGNALAYTHTSTVLDRLERDGHITAIEHESIRAQLTKKGRPLL